MTETTTRNARFVRDAFLRRARPRFARLPSFVRTAASTAVLLSLLLPGADARAQEQTATNPFPLNVPTGLLSFSGRDCRAGTPPELLFSWELTPQFPDTDELEVFVSKSTQCSSADLQLVEPVRVSTRDPRFPVESEGELIDARDLFDVLAEDCGGDDGVSGTVTLCVRYHTQTVLGQATEATSAQTITLDSVAPSVPGDVEALSLDGGLRVQWSMPSGSGAERFEVEVRDAGASDVLFTRMITGGDQREANVFGLENESTYEVRVRALDDAGSPGRASTFGNISDFSEFAEGTPRNVEDFFERYRRMGGSETGGCSSTGGAGWGMAAFAALVFLRRRGFQRPSPQRHSLSGGPSRVVGPLLAAGLVFFTADAAIAQDSVRLSESKQRFWFEIRTGPFQPGIDDEPGLSGTPFRDIFGNKHPLLTRLEFGVDLFDAFGRLGVGLAAGYWHVNGRGLYPSDDPAVEDERALDHVSLTLWPFTPVVNYRFDWFWKQFRVPLVPYAKAGYGLVRWTSHVSDRLSRDDAGNLAEGFGHGFEWAGGLHLVLNALEPSAAAALDEEVGVNASALYFEVLGSHWRGANGLRFDGISLGGGLHLAF